MIALAIYKTELETPVDIWLKIDSGSGRTGLPWDQPAAVTGLAQVVNQSEKTRLRGLLTHAGNTYSASSPGEICQRYQDSVNRMTGLRTDLWGSAYGLLEVSVGDTPGCTLCPDLGQVDEIRPGNFVFYDGQMLRLGVCHSAASGSGAGLPGGGAAPGTGRSGGVRRRHSPFKRCGYRKRPAALWLCRPFECQWRVVRACD